MADIIKALQEGTDAAGGYLVPEQYVKKLQKLVYAKSVAIPEMTEIKMTSDTTKIPKMAGGGTAYWVSETGTITESNQSFGIITLTAKKVAALATISTELLEDNAVNVAQVVVDDFSKAIALEIDKQEIQGDGTVFTGIADTSATTNLVDAGANALSLDHINSAIKLILEDNHDYPDRIFLHPSRFIDLINMTDSNNRPLFEEVLKEGEIGKIKGMNVRVSTQVPSNKVVIGKSKDFGYHGMRRTLKMQKQYQISTDTWVYQVNTRVGFAIKYPDSFAIIHNLA